MIKYHVFYINSEYDYYNPLTIHLQFETLEAAESWAKEWDVEIVHGSLDRANRSQGIIVKGEVL